MTGELTKKEIQEQWEELYQYIKTDILQYEESMKLPKKLILRLKGLKDGKFMANKNTKPMGDYSFKLILLTFKINKFQIIKALSNKDKFKDESHMINYLMAIVESKMNDTYARVKKVERAQEEGEHVVVNICEPKAEYKKKSKEVKSSRLKDLI